MIKKTIYYPYSNVENLGVIHKKFEYDSHGKGRYIRVQNQAFGLGLSGACPSL